LLTDGPEPDDRLALAPMYRKRRQSLLSIPLTQCRPSLKSLSMMNLSCAVVSGESVWAVGAVAMIYTAKKTDGS